MPAWMHVHWGLPGYFRAFVVIPAKAEIHAHRDVGGRAASGTGGRGSEVGGRRDGRFLEDGALDCRACDCHSRCAGMNYLNHWIPCPSFQTRFYYLGRLFPTRLYHLHPCRRAFAGMTTKATQDVDGRAAPACRRQVGNKPPSDARVQPVHWLMSLHFGGSSA